MIFNSTVVEVVDGRFKPVEVRIEYEGSHQFNLAEFFECMQLIIYYNDPMFNRLLPECMNVSSYNVEPYWLTEIMPDIFKPSILDIERCYYDDSGIPQHMQNYYEGIVVLKPKYTTSWIFSTDDDIITTSGSGTESFKSILKRNISLIINID